MDQTRRKQCTKSRIDNADPKSRQSKIETELLATIMSVRKSANAPQSPHKRCAPKKRRKTDQEILDEATKAFEEEEQREREIERKEKDEKLKMKQQKQSKKEQRVKRESKRIARKSQMQMDMLREMKIHSSAFT